jgi:hypothetical protein
MSAALTARPPALARCAASVRSDAAQPRVNGGYRGQKQPLAESRSRGVSLSQSPQADRRLIEPAAGAPVTAQKWSTPETGKTWLTSHQGDALVVGEELARRGLVVTLQGRALAWFVVPVPVSFVTPMGFCASVSPRRQGGGRQCARSSDRGVTSKAPPHTSIRLDAPPSPSYRQSPSDNRRHEQAVRTHA